MSALARLRPRWAARRSAPPPMRSLPLRWETIEASRAAEHPGLVSDVLERRSDGVTVTGVFSQEEIDAALAGLEGVERLERPFGWLLGMALGMLGPDEARSVYYDDTDRARAEYRAAFGFDPHDRVAAVLQPMVGSLKPVPAAEGDREYNPGQIRWWEPNQGGLPAHVGNEFRSQLADGAMRHLLSVTTVTDHLSYFVVLQRADQGGELSVYDLLFEQNRGTDAFTDGKRDDAWIESVDHKRLDLAPGDMVVFGGGWRWHRVETPQGTKPRITYGGFAATSLDGDELHFWA